MKLPSANEAEVPRAKIVRYLLDPNQRAGKSKARFFSSHGFAVERWQELAEALRRHVRENDITKREQAALGDRFVVEGPISMPDATRTGQALGCNRSSSGQTRRRINGRPCWHDRRGLFAGRV